MLYWAFIGSPSPHCALLDLMPSVWRMTHVVVESLEDCLDRSGRSVCMFCVFVMVSKVFKIPLNFQKISELKINQKLLLEIWSTAFLSTFIYFSVQKCKDFPLRATEGDLWLRPFSQCVLGKKNEAVFDQTTVCTPPEAVENVSHMPPAVGENTDHTQTISSREYKTTNDSIQGLWMFICLYAMQIYELKVCIWEGPNCPRRQKWRWPPWFHSPSVTRGTVW